VDVDTLARMSGLSASTVQGSLLELELAGLIRREIGNKVVRCT
jgi:predicted Rossmann fold nucleotide-binding protein DprA/Smf involved in DNA uptake